MLDFLKDLFGDKALSFEELSKAVSDKGLKVADLSTGEYVSKSKFDNLSTQLSKSEDDIKSLRTQLENSDNAEIGKLKSQIDDLIKQRETDKAEADALAKKQAYDYACRDYANGIKFSSKKAKEGFISDLQAKGLQLENNKILGADDFTAAYKEEYADSFFVEMSEKDSPKPTFTQKTNPESHDSVTKEQFDKMGYKQRIEFKSNNPGLYEKFNN